jgi:SagB-type dehydrogenase family enzyme
MQFAQTIAQAQRKHVRVFMSWLFSGGEAEEQILSYLASIDADAAKAFYVIMSPQWFEVQMAKSETRTGEDLVALDAALLARYEEFMNTFPQAEADQQQEVTARRRIMKSDFEEGLNFSDQTMGLPMPPLVKAHEVDAVIMLPEVSEDVITQPSLMECIRQRKSRRKFNDAAFTLAELSFLLWATQGVHREIPNKATFRTVPSGGARHPFETYLAVQRVDGLKPGIYRYLPREHGLVFCHEVEDLKTAIYTAALQQQFAADAAVSFIWTAVPYRCEWRYATEAAKLVSQDSGHLCQNLYLAVEALQCGTCAIGAYSQTKMDALVRVDGTDEFVVYLAPVGKLSE